MLVNEEVIKLPSSCLSTKSEAYCLALEGFMRIALLVVLVFSGMGLGCSSEWVPFSSLPYQEGAFPETHVTYFRYSFQVPEGKPVKIRIRGFIPKSRYITFNLYSEETRSSVGSLPDTQLIVDGLKTYRLPQEGESYTLWLTSHPDDNLSNHILLTPNENRSYEIWYRIYLPEKDLLGGAPLPQIETFEDKPPFSPTCLKTQLPLDTHPPVLGDFTKLPPRPTENKEIFFYATRGLGFYNNGDNHYLTARLDFSKDQLFALLKFKAPTFGKPTDRYSPPDVRYFSFCMGSARTTTTSDCLADHNMKTSADGSTYVLIGPEDWGNINFKQLAESKRINFLSKGKNFMPLVIYRNVLTRSDFVGQFNYQYSWPPELSEITKEDAAASYAQHRLIGPYAPVGQQMNAQEVLDWLILR
jgi:hypothetical protein